MEHIVVALTLMAVAVAIHLVGGLETILYLRRRAGVPSRYPLAHGLVLLVGLFAILLLLHLMQVSIWALLYWWRIGWDFNTALYFSTVTYATIGYGDVVPPSEWRLVAVMQGLTGVLMLGWSSAMVFTIVMTIVEVMARAEKEPTGGPDGQ